MCLLLTGDSNDNKPAVVAEEEEVAKMGCPSLGEHTKMEVVIEESYEFKVNPVNKEKQYSSAQFLAFNLSESLPPPSQYWRPQGSSSSGIQKRFGVETLCYSL